LEYWQITKTDCYIPKVLQIENTIWQKGVKYIAGVDEAGCGPLAGPVVAAAVIFPKYYFLPEVKDSKKLTPNKRKLLYKLITENAVCFGVGLVAPDDIDKFNIRTATFKAMRIAIGKLMKQPDYILFDGYELPEKIYSQEAVIKGDELSFTIAAASIIAKVTRDQLMVNYHQLFPDYGFDKHKGYGTAHHRKMIKQHGPCSIHRKSFLRKILKPIP